jgi:glycerol-3-phosphate dehydrogenase
VKRSTTRGGDARTAALAALATESFDLLVIGGGITGAGVARDAASRGLRTALVERDDFGSGTSSRSSRLVHGGVRYLEYGYFHLVFEASRERRVLLRIAPHLVHPLAFTWPVYRGARLQRWKLGAGLLLYDSLALFRNVARHRRLTAADLLKREPGLRTDDLVGGAVYFDAATDDARLTLTNAIAAAATGAVVANHAAVESIEHDASGRATGVRVRDALTGTTCIARARVIVNAAGPWGDAVRRLDEPGETPAVHGTKGVHLAVPAARVGNTGAVTLISPLDGRVMFVLPAGAFTIIGTTDTETTASPDTVRADARDIAYLLDSVNAMFPAAHLTRADVVSAWAGIRPLVAAGNAGDPASASREHAIVTGPSGMLTVSGGKLTTYRAMAAEVVGVVEVALGRAVTPSRTAIDHLPGADRAAAVADLAAPNASLSGALVPGLHYTGADLVYGAQSEMACTLSDLLIRRTHIAFETRDAGTSIAPLAADLVARSLGWDADERKKQVEDYERDAARIFGIDP